MFMEIEVELQKEQSSQALASWHPQWLVDTGYDCQCGITIDDHCYVV